jgi:hypothetical protein
MIIILAARIFIVQAHNDHNANWHQLLCTTTSLGLLFHLFYYYVMNTLSFSQMRNTVAWRNFQA